MRNEKELDVDVHTRALRAADRVRSNGKLQEVKHEPVVEQSVWERLRSILPQSEVLEVTGRAVKGFVIPHWAAGVLLAAILSGMAFMYSRMEAQRDVLIKLETLLGERDRHELEYRNEFKTKLNVQQLQIDQSNKELAIIKTLLTPQQVRVIERETRRGEH